MFHQTRFDGFMSVYTQLPLYLAYRIQFTCCLWLSNIEYFCDTTSSLEGNQAASLLEDNGERSLKICWIVMILIVPHENLYRCLLNFSETFWLCENEWEMNATDLSCV